MQKEQECKQRQKTIAILTHTSVKTLANPAAYNRRLDGNERRTGPRK